MPRNEERQKVLRIDSVLGFVGTPEWEHRFQRTDRCGSNTGKCAITLLPVIHFLKTGQRVRIRSGALDGLEGILLSRKGRSQVNHFSGCDAEISGSADRRVRRRTNLKCFLLYSAPCQRTQSVTRNTIETARLLVVSHDSCRPSPALAGWGRKLLAI